MSLHCFVVVVVVVCEPQYHKIKAIGVHPVHECVFFFRNVLTLLTFVLFLHPFLVEMKAKNRMHWNGNRTFCK